MNWFKAFIRIRAASWKQPGQRSLVFSNNVIQKALCGSHAFTAQSPEVIAVAQLSHD